MSEHTPGPWSLRQPRNDPNAYDVYAGELLITRGYWACNGKANAALIEAAPELLALLKDIDWDEHGDIVGWPNRSRFDAAIAKAEGK